MLSLLRWPGGKTRAASKIFDYYFPLPKYTSTLVSPFLGGASVEIYAASKGIKVIGYDNFHSLICFWNFVKKHRYEMSILLEKYLPLIKEEFYDLQNKLITWDVDKKVGIDVAVAFYVLNRASFSGSTLSGGMSPNHPRFNKECINRLKSFNGMDNITIEHMDFKQSIPLHPNEWLYCDPPYYLDKNKNNLYGINGNLHRHFDHQGLFDILSKRDKFVLSYNDCEYIRELYKNFTIYPISWKYGMSKNKHSKEIIITSRI